MYNRMYNINMRNNFYFKAIFLNTALDLLLSYSSNWTALKAFSNKEEEQSYL